MGSWSRKITKGTRVLKVSAHHTHLRRGAGRRGVLRGWWRETKSAHGTHTRRDAGRHGASSAAGGASRRKTIRRSQLTCCLRVGHPHRLSRPVIVVRGICAGSSGVNSHRPTVDDAGPAQAAVLVPRRWRTLLPAWWDCSPGEVLWACVSGRPVPSAPERKEGQVQIPVPVLWVALVEVGLENLLVTSFCGVYSGVIDGRCPLCGPRRRWWGFPDTLIWWRSRPSSGRWQRRKTLGSLWSRPSGWRGPWSPGLSDSLLPWWLDKAPSHQKRQSPMGVLADEGVVVQSRELHIEKDDSNTMKTDTVNTAICSYHTKILCK